MLTKDDNLLFLQKKINDIKTAIFKADINSILRLPNNIISTLKADKDGNIWFFTSCNYNYAKNVDKHFFATLDYHQKGGDYHLRIGGKASIVENDNEFHTSAINDNPVLIKLKITQQAEYFENTMPASSLLVRCKHFFTELFIQRNHLHFDFSEAA